MVRVNRTTRAHAGLLVPALVMAAALSGCSDPATPMEGPGLTALGSAAMRRASPAAHDGPIGLDSVFHEIGGRVKGFAGFYADADGTVTVMLVDRAQNGLARREVSDVILRSRGRALGRMKLREVRYDFRTLYGWKQAIDASPTDVGLAISGICEEQNRICIGVRRGGGLAAARSLVAQLGIPSDAVAIEETDPVQARKLLVDMFSPVPGGVVITPGCTLGYNAYGEGYRWLFTAGHCTNAFGDDAAQQTYVAQPSGYRIIGLEFKDPPTFPCAYNSKTYACRYSDAAAFIYHDTVAYRLGRIARPYYTTISVDPANPEFRIIGERAYPYLGELVTYVGRTSGWQEGTVNWTCADITMNFTAANGATVRLLCQDRFGVNNQGGDSGAPVFYRTSSATDVYLAGIMHGGDGVGNSWYSSMQNIEFRDGFGDFQTTGP